MEKLSAEEREVHFWLDDVDRKWKADASIPKYIRRFERMGWEKLLQDCDQSGRPIYAMFEAPEHAVSIRAAEKKKREYTEEQRTAAARRLSEVRNAVNLTEN